jgi:hypothetical protein
MEEESMKGDRGENKGRMDGGNERKQKKRKKERKRE